jgi:hypothetical protein
MTASERPGARDAAGAAAASAPAFLLIAPVNPDGVTQGHDRRTETLGLIEPYQPWLGGEPRKTLPSISTTPR